MDDGLIDAAFTLVPLRMDSINRISAIGLITIWNASGNGLFIITSQTVVFSQLNTSDVSRLDKESVAAHCLRKRILKMYQ